MVAKGQELAPPETQDLHAAQRPAETLLLESVEIQRHHARAVRGAVVHTAIPTPEHAQTGLRVFGDALLIPTADLIEHRPPDQPHRAAEDDRVAMRAARH